MVPVLIICTTCILLDICGGRLAEKVAFAIEIVKEIMPPSNIFMKICRGGLCSGGLKQIYIVKDPSHLCSSTPNNTSFCVGPITLCQLIWNPKSVSNCSRVIKAC